MQDLIDRIAKIFQAYAVQRLPARTLTVTPPQVPEGSPSLADQNWARRFAQDYKDEKAKRPNWQPTKAVERSYKEAQDILDKVNTSEDKTKAAEDLHQRLSDLGY